MFHKLVPVCLAFVLAACQGFPFRTPTSTPTLTPVPTSTLTPTPEPTSTPTPFPEEFYGEAKIGNYRIKIQCKGDGEPTIILENGLDINSWGKPRFDEISRTCIYSRAGMGLDKAIGPRTTLDQVNDLHELLSQTGVPGPYILVGHSIAGYNLMVYTDQYPDEVVGLVCVDCRLPWVADIFLSKLEEKFANETDSKSLIQEAIFRFGVEELVPGNKYWQSYREKLDIFNSAPQVRKLISLGDRPFVVLVADYSSTSHGEIENLFNASFNEMQEKLVQLSTQGRIEFIRGATHTNITFNAVVTKAIQEVYDKVTSP